MARRTLLLVVLSLGCGSGQLRPYAVCNDSPEHADAGFPPLAAELLVPDVDTGITWYRDTVGFTLLFTAAPAQSCFAELELEGARVLLSHQGGVAATPNDAIELRFVVRDVDALEARCKEKGVTFLRPIANQRYGLRDFVVRDPYGFRVRFGTPR